MTDNLYSGESKDYRLVTGNLKAYQSGDEYYSVPKVYSDMLDLDMSEFSTFTESISAHSDALSSMGAYQIMRNRVDGMWKRYLNSLREGASPVRITHLRETNRKTMFLGRIVYNLCFSLIDVEVSKIHDRDIIDRRLNFSLEMMGRVFDEANELEGLPFPKWTKKFLIKLHSIN